MLKGRCTTASRRHVHSWSHTAYATAPGEQTPAFGGGRTEDAYGSRWTSPRLWISPNPVPRLATISLMPALRGDIRARAVTESSAAGRRQNTHRTASDDGPTATAARTLPRPDQQSSTRAFLNGTAQPEPGRNALRRSRASYEMQTTPDAQPWASSPTPAPNRTSPPLSQLRLHTASAPAAPRQERPCA